MSYVTNQDIQSWLGTAAYVALTDDAGAGHADEAKVTEARLGAEGEANSYLATRYQTPLALVSESEVAAVLRTVVLDLAAYRLHSRRPPVPADVIRRHDEALQWLTRVAAGLAQLPSVAPLAVNSALGTIGQAAGPDRAMTRDGLCDL